MAAVLSIPLPMLFGYWKESLRDKIFGKLWSKQISPQLIKIVAILYI